MATSNNYKNLYFKIFKLLEGLKYYYPDVTRVYTDVPESYEDPKNRELWEKTQQITYANFLSEITVLTQTPKNTDPKVWIETILRYYENLEKLINGETPDEYPAMTIPPDLLKLEEERIELLRKIEDTRSSADDIMHWRFQLKENSKLIATLSEQRSHEIKEPVFTAEPPIPVEEIREQVKEAEKLIESIEKTEGRQSAIKPQEAPIYLVPAMAVPFPPPRSDYEPVINKLISDASNLSQDDFVQSYLSQASVNLNNTIAFSGGVTSATLAEKILRTFWITVKGGRDGSSIARAIAGDPNIKFNVSSTFTKDSISLLDTNIAKEIHTAEEAASKLLGEVVPDENDEEKIKKEQEEAIKQIGFEFIDSARFNLGKTAPLAFTKGFQFLADAGSLAFSKQNPVETSAFHLWTRGVTPQNLAAFIAEARKNGVDDKYLKSIAPYGSILSLIEQRHSALSRIFKSAYRGRYLRFVHEQKITQAEGSFVTNNDAATLHPDLFRGNFFTGLGRQLFGEVSSRFIARYLNPLKGKITSIVGPAFKKAAAGIATRLGIEAAGGALTGGIGWAAALVYEGVKLINKFLKKVPIVSSILQWMRKNKAATAAGLLAGVVLLPTVFLPIAVIYTFGQLAVYGGFVAGSIASATGVFFIGLAAIGKEIAQALIQAFIALTVLTLVVSFIIYIITTGAYVIPPSPRNLTYAGSSSGIVKESLYIGIEKVASINIAQNSDLPIEVTYNITVTAKRGSLTNIQFGNEYVITQDPLKAPIPSPTIPEPPSTLTHGESFSFSYSVNFDNNFEDSVVTDNFSVIADTEEVKGEEAISYASIIIGEPPSDCPVGWPVLANEGQKYIVNQGPEGTISHERREAIDVHWDPFTTETQDNAYIIATHNGTVLNQAVDNWGGLYVSTAGKCGGSDYMTWHVHFSSFSIALKQGDFVPRGTILGIMGHTGTATYIHDHYEFRALGDHNNGGPATVWPPPVQMVQPFVPVTVPRECVRNCGISIP